MGSKILNILSNETRLNLIICLSKGKKNVTELINTCCLSQSAVSQHLAKLREAGLVATNKEGKEVYYELKYPESAELSNNILNFIKEVKK